jgi:membrane protein implicated in regulation of membrane protease activity
MISETTKTLLFVAWVIAVCLAAIAIGIPSVPQWVVVALLAVVPPLVARRFWRAPEQTISESIHNARR